MNPVAEKVTGWTESQRQRKAVGEVFRIVNEETHCCGREPVARVAARGQVVGLANHSLLMARRQRAPHRAAAPDRNEKGEIHRRGSRVPRPDPGNARRRRR